MADNQFKIERDDVWEQENRWSLWTTGHDLHTTHEKRIPYILDVEKCHGVSNLGNSETGANGTGGSVSETVRRDMAGNAGTSQDHPNETTDDRSGGTCW